VKSYSLLYKATRDGFKISKFHELCDNKGATISFIKSKDHNKIFGGFTPIGWD
jgi:hypothetical protein